MSLKEASIGRRNNLDLIRFVAATLVIFGHAYPLGRGEQSLDLLGRASNGQIACGSLAVCIFFFYGGFLIARSAERLQSAKRFFQARISRIIPGLATVTLILAFVVGPIVTSLPLREYFSNGATYRYLLNSCMVLVHDLPGVFEGNVYGQTVNGPLWTLPVEFLCYILCFAACKLGFFREGRMKWSVPLFVAGYLALRVLLGSNPLLLSALRPVGLFYAGMLYYVYRDRVRLDARWALVAAAALVASAIFGILEATVFLFLPYLLSYLAFGTKHTCEGFARHGEVSYGMYLCAWPIQQCLCEGFGGSMAPLLNFALAFPCSIACGWLMAKAVEEPIARRLHKGREK